MKILTEETEDIIFSNDVDLTAYPDVLITGSGKVSFKGGIKLPDGSESGGNFEAGLPPMILIADNSQLTIESSSVDTNKTLIIESGIIVGNGSTVEIKSGTVLRVEKNATLLIKSGSSFIVNEGGKVVIENGAFLCVEDSSGLDIDSLAEFIMYTGVVFGTNPELELVTNCMDSLNFPGVTIECGSSLDADYAGPIADFDFEYPCTEIENKFDFTYTGGTHNGVSFLWDFGFDGIPSSSTLENPKGIMFESNGYKKISLTVTKKGCISSITKKIKIVNPVLYKKGIPYKVLICHVEGNNSEDIYIDYNELPYHLDHGDCIGLCSNHMPTDFYGEWGKGELPSSKFTVPESTSNVITTIPETVLEQSKRDDISLTNYPNPFNENTTINVNFPQAKSEYYLVIQNAIGVELYREIINPSENNIVINGSLLSAGIYFYSIENDNNVILTKKMIKTN